MIKKLLLHVTRVISAGWCAECLLGGASRTTQPTGWVGPKAGLDGCEKSRRPPGFDPRTVQPVASSYTD
jgi:hypothetical protein